MIGWGWVCRLGGEDVKSGRIGLGLGWVVIGIGRLCVVCATTENCCKCDNFIQIHAPVSHN